MGRPSASKVERFEMACGRVRSVAVRHDATPDASARVESVVADAFVSALPLEVMRRVADAPLIEGEVDGSGTTPVPLEPGWQMHFDFDFERGRELWRARA